MVRFGIAGTGRISDWVLEGAMQEGRFKAVAVCSRTEENARKFASKYDIRKAYVSIEQMAADPEVDAVYIGTPNHVHIDYALAAIEAGKHVMCEKPLAANAAEAEKMIEAARAKGVLLMEAMISTLNPNFRKALDIVNGRYPEYNLGKIRGFSASFCQYSTKYEQLKAGHISNSFSQDSAGGAAMDIGIYTIYPMVAMFGAPLSCCAKVGRFEVAGQNPDIQGCAIFDYGDFPAQAIWSKVADSTLPTQILGEEGTLIIDKLHTCRKMEYIRRGAPSSGRGAADAATDITVPLAKNPYFYEFEEFINCIESGAKESSINTLSASLQTMKLLDAVRSK